jgi:hypothetical protein
MRLLSPPRRDGVTVGASGAARVGGMGRAEASRRRLGQRWGNTPHEDQRRSRDFEIARNPSFAGRSLARDRAEKLTKTAHNPKVAGSNPAPATTKTPSRQGVFVLKGPVLESRNPAARHRCGNTTWPHVCGRSRGDRVRLSRGSI